VLTLVYLLAACGVPAEPGTEPAGSEPAVDEDRDSVVIAIDWKLSPDSLILDPVKLTDTTAVYAAWLLYDSLTYVSETGEVIMGLAENVHVSDDDTTYTFQLRQNAVFQDNTDLTAEDVRLSWIRAQTMIEEQEQHLPPVWADIESVEAIDDVTVKITLRSGSKAFLTEVVPKVPIVKSVSSSPLQGDVIGSGPFKLAVGPEGTIILEPNPLYGPTDFPVQQIELRLIEDDKMFFDNWQTTIDNERSSPAYEFLQMYYESCPECNQERRPGRCPRLRCAENEFGSYFRDLTTHK
jgi:ABC-type transport system substrate-binding protein